MSTPGPADKHLDAARARLAHLGGLAARTEQAEKKILEAAQSRLEAVDADLAKLRPRVLLDPETGKQYQSLTMERGQLQTVIGQSQQHLEPRTRPAP